MMRFCRNGLIWSLGFLCLTVMASSTPEDEIVLRYSQPDQPGFLSLELPRGSIKVVGTDEAEIRIVATPRQDGPTPRWMGTSAKIRGQGLPRVGGPTTGIRVQEADNRVTVEVPHPYPGLDIVLQVPRKTSLRLGLESGKGIHVKGVTGELEVTVQEGPLHLEDIRGSAVAHALSDKLVASFLEVTPDAAMSFTSMTGDLDITLPEAIHADLRLVTYQGEIFSDLKARFSTQGVRVEQDDRRQGGTYQMDFEQALHGTLGKGGPQYLFKSYQGNIYVRKQK